MRASIILLVAMIVTIPLMGYSQDKWTGRQEGCVSPGASSRAQQRPSAGHSYGSLQGGPANVLKERPAEAGRSCEDLTRHPVELPFLSDLICAERLAGRIEGLPTRLLPGSTTVTQVHR